MTDLKACDIAMGDEGADEGRVLLSEGSMSS